MKYEKPQLSHFDVILNKSMAAGLGEWLDNAGYDKTVEDHITTYEVNS